jgi:hypothetical protein
MPNFTNSDIELILNDPLAHSLDDLRIRTIKLIENVKLELKIEDNDTRVKVFHELKNINQSLLANLTFQRSIFINSNYWIAYFHSVPNEIDMNNFYREIDVLNRFSGFYGQFSVYESRIRHFQVAIDKNACSGGTATFDSVANWLLKKTNLKNYQSFCELLRLTRNTIHNNGIYRPTNNQNTQIEFNGTTYYFYANRPIDFADWKFLIIVSNNLLDMFYDLVNTNIIKDIESIND